MFASPTCIAEHNLDITRVREDWKFVLRRISVLRTMMGPRMPMSSRR
jgi:hypothetical protein